MKVIEVYTDGSATTPDKPGGWAYVLVIDGQVYSENSGYSPSASNNDMELRAGLEGLRATSDHLLSLGAFDSLDSFTVTLCSDSQLVLGWANGTFRFKQEHKIDKYNELRSLVKRLNVQTKWIKGHTGHIFNERCDKLANNARLGISNTLDKPIALMDTKIGTKKNGTICVWFDGKLKVIDLEMGLVENYNRKVHGKRGSALEIRRERER